jgi:hypothetical protein
MADIPSSRKAAIDALLLAIAGVSARRVSNIDGYFVADKMFACIGEKGVGLKLPPAVATELQFSRDGISAYSPGGMATTREWVQIERENPADHAKDLQLFQDSIDYVKKGRR